MGIEDQLRTAIGDRRGLAAADRLCLACVVFLDVDAAAISAVSDGANMGALGVSSSAARTYDELQFTLGEGPCLDAVAWRTPVMATDLAHAEEERWPAFRPALLAHGIRSVYAEPVIVVGQYIGALDLFRTRPGPWRDDTTTGAQAAVHLAIGPFADLLAPDTLAALSDSASDAFGQFARVDIGQATGMLAAQLNITTAQALLRLRAHAYAAGRSATEVARDIIEHRLHIDAN